MQIVSFLEKIEALPKSGKALDVGAKHFKDAIRLAQLGFEVTTIEPNEEDGQYDKNVINVKKKLEDAKLSSYDVIIANNVLPFTDDPLIQLNRLFQALNNGGVISFTLFGEKHEWQHLQLVEEPIIPSDFEVIHKKEVEGIVPTYSGIPTWWHSYEYVLRKVV